MWGLGGNQSSVGVGVGRWPLSFFSFLLPLPFPPRTNPQEASAQLVAPLNVYRFASYAHRITLKSCGAFCIYLCLPTDLASFLYPSSPLDFHLVIFTRRVTWFESFFFPARFTKWPTGSVVGFTGKRLRRLSSVTCELVCTQPDKSRAHSVAEPPEAGGRLQSSRWLGGWALWWPWNWTEIRTLCLIYRSTCEQFGTPFLLFRHTLLMFMFCVTCIARATCSNRGHMFLRTWLLPYVIQCFSGTLRYTDTSPVSLCPIHVFSACVISDWSFERGRPNELS